MLTAAEAWPAVMVLYFQGELPAAETVLARVADDGPEADRSLLAAWSASISWARGEIPACRTAAERAAALAGGEPRATAAAHTVLALLAAAEGDRRANDRHYALAMAAAAEAGDHDQQVRIRANRGSQRLEEGDLPGALAELDAALDLAATGTVLNPAMVGLAQHNRAEALLRGGRLAEARDGYRLACATLQRLGTGIVAYPLAGLGESHELRGDLQQARAAYEEAVSVARANGNAQALAPALCGLARVLAAAADPEAVEVAARAVAASTGLTEAAARNAAGWAVLATDPAAAREHAEAAAALSRAGRNPAALADALELSAMCAPPNVADRLLADSARVSADIGDRVAAARTALARARLGIARHAAGAGIVAEHHLRMLGADPATGTRSLAHLARTTDRTVGVQVLGSFALLRHGVPVPAAEWQSRKARDLLKILIGRRGRPISREALGDLLWPGESRIANRLSIALSVLRGMLDPDRGNHLIVGPDGLAYDPGTLRVDVDAFLHLAAAGLAAADAGRPDEARLVLTAAETAYAGDVLRDEPDLEAVRALREEARTTHLAVVRTLGALRATAGDTDGAVLAWLRLLEQEPYDEDGALRLIDCLSAAGRYGEAARHHQRYTERMRELGVPSRALPLARIS